MAVERNDEIVRLSAAGMTQRDIGAQLGVSIGTVNAVLKRHAVTTVRGRPPSPRTLDAGRRANVLHDEGISWYRIAFMLADEGYLTSEGKSVWYSSTVKRAAEAALRAEGR